MFFAGSITPHEILHEALAQLKTSDEQVLEQLSKNDQHYEDLQGFRKMFPEMFFKLTADEYFILFNM